MSNIFLTLRNKYFPSGSYRGDFMIMAVGRSISQLLPILITPILTRLYTPEDFGIFAIFISLVTIVSLISNGRYNLAITLPKNPQKSLNLLFLCFISTLVIGISFFLLVLIFQNQFLHIISMEGKTELVYLVPIGIIIVAFIESIYYWLLRLKQFKFLSINVIVQTTSITIFKIIFALTHLTWQGLILAQIFGSLFSLSFLIFSFLKSYDLKSYIKTISISEIFSSAKRYKKFPLYSLPADGINAISTQLPNFFLNSFFGTDVVGFFSLTQRVLGTPISFVASAVTDVFRERASSDFREKGSSRNVFIGTLKNLSLFSIFPFLLLFLFGPMIVPFLLGPEWEPAGEYIRILTFMFLFRFIASPLSSVLYISGKQIYFLLWQIGLLIVTIASFYIGKMIGNEISSILLFSVSYSVMYIILLLLGSKFTERKNEPEEISD